MSDNKVIIRINYDKDKQRKALIDPKMVTEWHTGRIAAVLIILSLILGLIFTWLLSGDDRDNLTPAVEAPASGEQLPSAPGSGAPESKPSDPLNPPVSAKKPSVNPIRHPAIIFDKRVIRASLNTSLKDMEPDQMVGAPLSIAPDQTTEVYYFSEVKGMKNKTLLHHWLKDGRVIAKKQLDIKDNRSKLISSRTLNSKDKGAWQVILVDRKGKLYSEANFEVNP